MVVVNVLELELAHLDLGLNVAEFLLQLRDLERLGRDVFPKVRRRCIELLSQFLLVGCNLGLLAFLILDHARRQLAND